jgi:hypothetical protein
MPVNCKFYSADACISSVLEDQPLDEASVSLSWLSLVHRLQLRRPRGPNESPLTGTGFEPGASVQIFHTLTSMTDMSWRKSLLSGSISDCLGYFDIFTPYHFTFVLTGSQVFLHVVLIYYTTTLTNDMDGSGHFFIKIGRMRALFARMRELSNIYILISL